MHLKKLEKTSSASFHGHHNHDHSNGQGQRNGDSRSFCRSELFLAWAWLAPLLWLGSAHNGWTFDTNATSEAKMVQEVRVALQITHRIHTEGINIYPVHVGEVILSGKVPSLEEMEFAVSTAASVSGMHKVIDQLSVGSPLQIPQGPALKASIERQIDNDPSLSADDTVIVKTDHQIGGKAEVTLGGIVSTWKDEQSAVTDAFAAGASRVVSQLVVRSDPHSSMMPRSFAIKPQSDAKSRG